MVDKVRIKKYQQPKVKQWSQALEIPESRFVEDAVTFYIRYLEGKQQETINPITVNPTPEAQEQLGEDIENLEEFTGSIEL
ncbi:MAG: hypothetical protein WBF90_38155 [Rivularia sp. (in: cyanobacteria)]